STLGTTGCSLLSHLTGQQVTCLSVCVYPFSSSTPASPSSSLQLPREIGKVGEASRKRVVSSMIMRRVGVIFAAMFVFMGTGVHGATTTATNTGTSFVCFDESAVGDGDCDRDNNFAECGYDGGDCCECTCVSEGEYDCGAGGFACIDPAAECVNDDDVTFQIASTCVADMIGDAYCDEPNNVEECGYDGGDCCPCTCEDIPTYPCGSFSRFSCVDPNAPCVNDTEAPTPVPTPMPPTSLTAAPVVVASSSSTPGFRRMHAGKMAVTAVVTAVFAAVLVA
ncbi:unnamed protein product, partial [Ectocarpus sp. 13 AM-2016]